MKTKIQMLLILVLLSTAVANAAMLTLVFDSSLLYAQPGQQVTFSGTLTNTGTTTVFLNGDSVTFPLPVDDTPFFLQTPPALGAGASATASILDVLVPGGTPPGLYTGSFSVVGGDSAASLDVLTTNAFAVQVVPEPATSGLIAVGVTGLFLLRRRLFAKR
jgi:hypothetical protein